MKKYFIILFVLLLAGCKPQQLIVHDIEFRDRIVHDSINITKHDSIRITQKGDTIFYQVWKTEFKYKTLIKTDSVYKYIDKPIYIDKIKEVPKKLNWFQTLFIWTGVIAIIALILLIVCFLAKIFIKKSII